MAVLLSKATGNFTSATGTWGVVDATSYLNAENATESLLTTAYSGTRSSAFTPGAIEIDGIAVKLCERIGTTGTMSVCLELDSDNSLVIGTEVTINTADLPSALEADGNGGWIFLKFAAAVTLSAATAYQVAAKTSDASMVDLWCDGTADNLSRCLRKTTNQAPAVSDDLIVTGEKTGAGAETAITVTMNETATTDYGSAPTAANSLITPGLSICDGGTVSYGTTAGTNYYLKMSNSVVVYSGGVFNIGTVATPIPRDSTAVLEFDPAADGDYGLIIRSGGTFVSQGLSRTSAKNVTWCLLNTDEAANSTSLGVDTDTGWLNNDEIAIASTTRTGTESEKGAMAADAAASALTVDGFAGVGGGLLNAHGGGGTANVIAEVILLTRNVKVRSATSTLPAYVYFQGGSSSSTVNIDWTEFYYLGENAVNKRGVEIQATFTGSLEINYSSIHDIEDGGLFSNSTAGSFSITYNTFYNLNTTQATAVAVYFASTSGTHTIDSNVFIVLGGGIGGIGVQMLDLASTFTNNRIAGCTISAGYMLVLEENNVVTIGSISGNHVHSGTGCGVRITATSFATMQTIGSMKIWRTAPSGGSGLILFGSTNTACWNVILDSFTLFGNFTTNIGDLLTSQAQGFLNVVFKSASIQGDASFSVTNGLAFSRSDSTYLGRIVFIDSNFGTSTAHTTADINGDSQGVEVILINTNLASTTEVASQSSMYRGAAIRSHKNDQSATTFKNWYRFGTITSDQTIRHTASGHSWKLTPNTANLKLILPGPSTFDTFKTAVNASAAVTITAYVYKDATYNGNAPRLVLVGGLIGGIAADVTDSLTVAAENWEQLSVVATPNEAGVVEYYIDCDGTAGNVYVDDIEISQA